MIKQETGGTNWIHVQVWEIIQRTPGRVSRWLGFYKGASSCKVMQSVCGIQVIGSQCLEEHMMQRVWMSPGLWIPRHEAIKSFRVKDKDSHNMSEEWAIIKERNSKNEQSYLRLNNQDILHGVMHVWDGSWQNSRFLGFLVKGRALELLVPFLVPSFLLNLCRFT